jgi:hypothetical protein
MTDKSMDLARSHRDTEVIKHSTTGEGLAELRNVKAGVGGFHQRIITGDENRVRSRRMRGCT